MHIIFFGLLLTCLAAVSYAALPKIDGQIVGGTDAAVGAHPYMVSLRRKNSHFCGGSIIAKRYILTAAHCLMKFTDPEDLKDVTVHAGTNLLSEAGYVYKPEAAILHPDFNLPLIRNDIGLLRLNTDIEYNKLVQPISVAKTNSVLTGDPCFLTGWGRLEFMGKVPDKLQKVNLKVYSQLKCKVTFWNVGESHICAFSQYGQGACHGDSGSPLVANGIQIGLASFVRPCAVGYPDVYTRTSTFSNWLAQYIVFITMNAVTGLIIACLGFVTYGLPDTQIVGGIDAQDGAYLYQASLRSNPDYPSHFCSGVIINEYYVLTNAQCVVSYKNPYDVYVAIGSHYLVNVNNQTKSVMYRAKKLIIHAGYNKLLHIHDIALIEVDKIKFNENIQPIDLPTADRNFDNYPLLATGWGRRWLGGPIPNRLQEIIVRGYPQELCSRYEHVKETHICTFADNEGMCHGDAGGPLVADSVLVGLISFSYGPCGGGAPDVATRVFSYRSWIKYYTGL
ncbi:hypothetical protein P5V15_005145 [Pogonomyrmex californicus]